MASRIFTRSFHYTRVFASKPPVQLFGLDGTYATALYSAASKESTIDKAYQSLSKIFKLIETDKKVGVILSNPALSANDRTIVIDTIIEKTSNLDTTVSNLLKVLSENNRLDLFSSIYSQFQILNDAHNGLIEATVTSVQPLERAYLRRIEAAISKSSFVGEGKTLKLVNKTNPDILGGLVVEVGDRTVDLSISSKIAKLNKVLQDSI
ncbi:F1F0 ATP synthase subunit 5 [Ascoidea rubescens DSM 1968]|uniref:ATP synthase subunit 5, mitochondrial n=1 Tax=Ascoidea rubescens DSM 1968 TaxID=1344418 RepID=A0A1D2VCF5_9ASCO|nr:F1 complex, OSCP/delta subunit of ATPase [Ascoidea rubescens DSM 1968]ODV59305.1 F1 complex, OSCP/delta subunit of ATPase [Ascoidea rubescens DSM 1968]